MRGSRVINRALNSDCFIGQILLRPVTAVSAPDRLKRIEFHQPNIFRQHVTWALVAASTQSAEIIGLNDDLLIRNRNVRLEGHAMLDARLRHGELSVQAAASLSSENLTSPHHAGVRHLATRSPDKVNGTA